MNTEELLIVVKGDRVLTMCPLCDFMVHISLNDLIRNITLGNDISCLSVVCRGIHLFTDIHIDIYIKLLSSKIDEYKHRYEFHNLYKTETYLKYREHLLTSNMYETETRIRYLQFFEQSDFILILPIYRARYIQPCKIPLGCSESIRKYMMKKIMRHIAENGEESAIINYKLKRNPTIEEMQNLCFNLKDVHTVRSLSKKYNVKKLHVILSNRTIDRIEFV
jgi:hypothetical protein